MKGARSEVAAMYKTTTFVLIGIAAAKAGPLLADYWSCISWT